MFILLEVFYKSKEMGQAFEMALNEAKCILHLDHIIADLIQINRFTKYAINSTEHIFF